MNGIMEYIHFPRNNMEISLLNQVIILISLLLILMKIVDDFHWLSPKSTTESGRIKYGGSLGIRKDLNGHHGANKTKYKYYDKDTSTSTTKTDRDASEGGDGVKSQSPKKRRRRVSSDSNETPEMGPRYHSRSRRRGSMGSTVASSPLSAKSYQSNSSHSSPHKSGSKSLPGERGASSPDITALDFLEKGMPYEEFFAHSSKSGSSSKRSAKKDENKNNGQDAAAHDTLYLNRINMLGLFPVGSLSSPDHITNKESRKGKSPSITSSTSSEPLSASTNHSNSSRSAASGSKSRSSKV